VFRHTKSLNIDSDYCGRCMNKFELLMNVKSQKLNSSGNDKEDENKIIIHQKQFDQPLRTPNKYNSFVKNNFQKFKQLNPQLSTPLLMKQLSEAYKTSSITSERTNDENDNVYSNENHFCANSREAELARDDENTAALVIQSYWRGCRVRRHIRYLNRCATVIQTYWHGFKAKQIYRQRLKEDVINTKLKYYDDYATRIQKIWRGYYIRKYIFNYYSRKKYFNILEQKNEQVRFELHEYREYLEQKELEQHRMKNLQKLEEEAKRTHYLMSTKTCSGVYNSKFLHAPKEMEIILRNIKFDLPKLRQQKGQQTDVASIVLPPLNPKPQGPFRSPDEVRYQRYRSLKPSLRCESDYYSAEKMREELKLQEWTERIHDETFKSGINRDKPYQRLLTGTEAFSEEKLCFRSGIDRKRWISEKPEALMLTCVDSRVVASRLTQAVPGQLFIVRNPGNLVPKYSYFENDTTVGGECGALELACSMYKAEAIVIFGHSDCKALNLLFSIRDQMTSPPQGPLEKWLKLHGWETVQQYKKLEQDFTKKLKFQGSMQAVEFEAFIDSGNNFAVADKFSQVNTLQQLKNFLSYPFLEERLNRGELQVHALWFDIYTGDVYMFSFEEKCFVKIDELSYERLTHQCLAC
ncbi:unnamed protein product, partial [Didymodactylos carnosus]